MDGDGVNRERDGGAPWELRTSRGGGVEAGLHEKEDGDVPEEHLEPKTPRNVIQEHRGDPGGQREVANEGWRCS